jgi:HEAT repeat protein
MSPAWLLAALRLSSLSTSTSTWAGAPAWPGAPAVDARAAAALPDGTRLRAVEQVGLDSGPAARPLMIPFLRDSDAGVRLFTARWLARANEPAALEAAVSWIMTPVVAQIDRRLGLDVLRDAPAWTPAARHAVERAARDADASVRSAALDALERHDASPSLSTVLVALEDDNREVRLRAVRIAGASGDPRAALPLLGRLEDADRQVRIDATRALGAHPSARPALLRLATDGPDDVRAAAVDALAQLRVPEAVPLLAVLARRRPADELARRAQLALGRIATPDAIAAIIALTRSPPVSDEAKVGLRRAGAAALPALAHEVGSGTLTSAALALSSLAALGDRRATAPLVAAVDRGGELAPIALDALAALGDRAAVPTVLRAAESTDVATRRRALAALVTLADPRGVVALDRGLADPDPRVRESAAKLAEVLGARAATNGLITLLADKSGAVRDAAASALAAVGVPAPNAVTAVAAAAGRVQPDARDDHAWVLLAAAVERVAQPDDVDRLSAALRDARGIARLPWLRGLAGAGASKPLTGRNVLDPLFAALAEGDLVALAAADALAAASLGDEGRVALSRAFEAAAPPVRARLCAAVARVDGGAGWLAAILRSPREPVVVRAAAAWAARPLRDSNDVRPALTEAAAREDAGPISSNARAAQTANAPSPRATWTEVRVRGPDGIAEAGRWVSISSADGVSVWVTTDASGAARLRDLPGGPLTLRVAGGLLRRDAP